MRVKGLQADDIEKTAELIAKFRVELASLKGVNKEPNIDAAIEELNEYIDNGFPVYIAQDKERIEGYIVCRVDGQVVWAESLYVLPDYRRNGVASLLYNKSEELAKKLGSDTVYNWVHPNNEKIIRFLDKKGYNVLNLIEVRKPWPSEKIREKIKVGCHEFDF